MNEQTLASITMNGYNIKLIDKGESNVIGCSGFQVGGTTPDGTHIYNYTHLTDAHTKFTKFMIDALNHNVKLD